MSVNEADGAGARRCGSELMAQVSGDLTGTLLKNGARWGEVRADFGLMESGAADERSGGHGNADGAADVAQHIEQAGGVAHLFAGDG